MFSRCSGVLLPIFSLPSSHGIGDLGAEAREFVDRLVEAGQTWWQILPLSPTNNENSNSPYFSTSAFAGNPLLIDLRGLAAEGLLQYGDIGAFHSSSAHKVDYDAVRAFKMPLLERAWQRFRKMGKNEAFDNFCREQQSWLDDYAVFETLKNLHDGRCWNDWPDHYKNRQKKALQDFVKEQTDAIELQKFIQFLFFRQWQQLRDYIRNRGLTVVGDMPIYVSYDSCDVWCQRDCFKLDKDGSPMAVSGVPPDYFSATGQLWNNPVYNWDQLQKNGFDWWVRRMEALFERYDVVRIDHFRGLVQYWEVPAGEVTAINGSWQDVPTREFFDTLMDKLESFPVIAEDLGIITDDVKEWMEHYDFPGMKVLQFAFGHEDDPGHAYLPHNYDQNCIVYTGTHDNQTSGGWWDSASSAQHIQVKRYLGRDINRFSAPGFMCRLAMASVADVAVLPLQDLLGLGDEARINDPSHIMDNWHWRLSREQLDSVDWAFLGELTWRYGRAGK